MGTPYTRSWREKIERGYDKPTPGLSFLGFYNLTLHPFVRASEETITVV